MNYKEKIKVAEETGMVSDIKFQEKATYKMANGFDCPHCNAYHGNGKDKKSIVDDKNNYVTSIDIEFMCKHEDSYSWTEDVKCGNCGKMYSQSNGC